MADDEIRINVLEQKSNESKKMARFCFPETVPSP